MAAYIDTNVLVFAFIDKAEKGEKARSILDKVVRGEIDAMTSYLTFDEMFWNVKKIVGKQRAMEYSKAAIEMRNLRFLDVDGVVIRKAHELLSKYQLHPRDAIHTASAIVNGASSIISDDKDLSEITEIKREKLSPP